MSFTSKFIQYNESRFEPSENMFSHIATYLRFTKDDANLQQPPRTTTHHFTRTSHRVIVHWTLNQSQVADSTFICDKMKASNLKDFPPTSTFLLAQSAASWRLQDVGNFRGENFEPSIAKNNINNGRNYVTNFYRANVNFAWFMQSLFDVIHVWNLNFLLGRERVSHFVLVRWKLNRICLQLDEILRFAIPVLINPPQSQKFHKTYEEHQESFASNYTKKRFLKLKFFCVFNLCISSNRILQIIAGGRNFRPRHLKIDAFVKVIRKKNFVLFRFSNSLIICPHILTRINV